MPLNIDWQQILLHLFNFIILFAVLYFLLYKPVKQFMDKRTEYYSKLDEEAKLNFEESKKAKEEYLERLSLADNEISARKEKARKDIEETNAIKIRQAEDQAAKIIADAQQSLSTEREKMLQSAQNEILDMVTTATEKIVLKSGTSESYEQFLSAVERGGDDE